jgi:hypothetical protein
MGREVSEGDGDAVPRQPGDLRHHVADRGVEGGLALDDGVGEQKRGERLGHRADLEPGVLIDRPVRGRGDPARGTDDGGPVRCEVSDGNADPTPYGALGGLLEHRGCLAHARQSADRREVTATR